MKEAMRKGGNSSSPRNPRVASPGEYIAAFPEQVRSRLEELRRSAREAAPEAEEVISYSMPALKLHGSILVYFAGYKNHVGFYPTSSGIAAFEKELSSSFKVSKGAVRFPIGSPIPASLVKRIVKYRARAILEKSGQKDKSPARKGRTK